MQQVFTSFLKVFNVLTPIYNRLKPTLQSLWSSEAVLWLHTTQCLDNANEDYHNGATVREVCLDAEDIVVPNLNTSTVGIV